MKKLIKMFLVVNAICLLAFTGCSSEKPASTDGSSTEENNDAAQTDQDTTGQEGTDSQGEESDQGTDVSEEPVTYNNLLAAVRGEMNANAKYVAYAEVADQENYPDIARVFRALADAEQKHSDDEYAVLQTFGQYDRPQADPVTTGTTAENLQAALDGETNEFTIMYPEFVTTATEENIPDASSIFSLAMQAEAVHANIYTDIIANLENFDGSKYAHLYRCPTCGNVELERPESCIICSLSGSDFIEY